MANMMQEMLLRDSQEYRQAIKQELEETKKEFAVNEEQRKELQRKVDNLIEDLKQANQRLETATKNSFVIMSLKQQVSEMSNEMESLRKEVERLTILNKELVTVIETLEIQLREKEIVISKLERQLKEIQNGN
jgi:predicted RNase H-like nuclease (RuvC/YqgF family)